MIYKLFFLSFILGAYFYKLLNQNYPVDALFFTSIKISYPLLLLFLFTEINYVVNIYDANMQELMEFRIRQNHRRRG